MLVKNKVDILKQDNNITLFCTKCGEPTAGQYQAYGYPLCKICACWFGTVMVSIRNSLIDVSTT